MNLSQAQLKEIQVLKWLKEKRNKPMSQRVNKNVKAPNAFYEQSCKPYQFNDVPLELLKLISIPDMSEFFVHKDCYLKLTIIKPCFKVIAIHSRVQDHEGNEVDISFYNFSKRKDCRALFPVGTVIFVKEPYYRIAAQGNKNIRIDNPRDVEFESERLLNQTLEQKYRRQGRELMEDRQYVEAYLLYHEAIGKTNGSRESNRFLLDKAIACYHLNLYQDYLSHAELVAQFEPSNIEAYCHIFKALIMLGKFKKAEKILEEKAEYFEKDTVKELRQFSEEVKKTKENHVDWHSAFTKKNIVGNYLSPKIKNQKTKKGFGIIAQETIEPGEILIIEQPFLFINLEDAPNQQNPIFNENSIVMHEYCSNLYALSKNFRIKLNDFAVKHGIIPQSEGQSTEDKFSPRQKFKIIFKHSLSLNQFYEYFFPIGSKRLRRNNCGLFETVNMINHSCEENIERFCIGNTIIVFATVKIQKGEEILMDYKKSWENSTSEMYLYRQNCECELCTSMAANVKKGQTNMKGMSREMDRQYLMFELNQIQSKDPNKFARLIEYYDFQTMAFYYRKTEDMLTVAKMFTRVFQMDLFKSMFILSFQACKMAEHYNREQAIKNKQPRKPGFVSDDHTQTPFFRKHIENALKQDPLPLDQLIASYVKNQQKSNIKYWPKTCPVYPIKPYSQAILANLQPVMIQQLSEMMGHKGCYLNVIFVRDSIQQEAIVGRVKDQQGAEIDINIHNFDTKGKNCSTIFRKGTTIFIKEPYCKIKEEGNPSPKFIRIDNPRDIQFQAVSDAQNYRQKGVELVKQKKYLEAYLLYDQALKKIDDHQMTISFLLNKAIVSFHLNLLHDYYDSTCVVLEFDPTNIKALYHKFKALVLLNDEKQAVEFMQDNKQQFTADHLKQMKEFLEKVRKTRENNVDWYTAIKTQSIVGEYFSNKISIQKTKEGLGIFAKEKIPPGVILIIEKAFFYSKSVQDQFKNTIVFNKDSEQIQSHFKKLYSISKDFRSKVNSIINQKQLSKKESKWLEENVSERCPQTLAQKLNKKNVLFNRFYAWLRQHNQILPMSEAGLFEKNSLIKNCSNKENIDRVCLGNTIITFTIKQIPKGGQLIASFIKNWLNNFDQIKKNNPSIRQQIFKHYDTMAMGFILRSLGKNTGDVILASKMLRRVFPMTESHSIDIMKKCLQK